MAQFSIINLDQYKKTQRGADPIDLDRLTLDPTDSINAKTDCQPHSFGRFYYFRNRH